MKPYAPNIAKEIISLLSSERSVRSVDIVDIIEKVLGKLDHTLSNGQKVELAFNIKDRVRFQLDKYLTSCVEKRIQPCFRWGEFDKDIIISIHNPGLVSGSEPEEAKYRLTGEIQKYLKQIDPALFEKLGQQLLEFINCVAFTTRTSKDHGIDFGGILKVCPVEEGTDYEINARLLQKFSIRIVGQAKRYSNDVEVKEVRELQGITHDAIIDRIVKQNEGEATAEILRKKSYPIVLMFITTSGYTRGAKDFASDVGMILMDGEQIAQSLLKMGYGCIKNEDGYWEFDQEGLDEWLNGL
ncbi:restriction endonuclease [Bacillus cereus]|uniref:restriction endonuclease n=1 Tax=Bacillus cereus group TaxID=86661 RepID=UPI000279BBDD|nr:restriction endonuclease [Bacillus cereus]EJR82317.1 hypothetical protein IKA_05449 [Bacillus cereus VD169]